VDCRCKFSSSKQIVGLPDRFRPRFLSGLTDVLIKALLSVATHKQFSTSSVVVHQEDPAERLFLLTSGRARHFVLTSDGRKVPMHWVTAGQIVGGAAILSNPCLYLASTELLSDCCVVVWERQTIRQFVSRFPILLDNALSIAVTEHIEGLIAANVSLNSDETGRIAQLLISFACGIGRVSPDGIEIHVGNEALAVGASVTAVTVSRTLEGWEREGVLTKGKGKILLRRPELLITKGNPQLVS
jgi:CRP-like cAMP-binding protein